MLNSTPSGKAQRSISASHGKPEGIMHVEVLGERRQRCDLGEIVAAEIAELQEGMAEIERRPDMRMPDGRDLACQP